MTGGRARLLAALLAGGTIGSAAHADRPKIGAFLDLQQVVESQLSGPGDDVTYSQVAGNLFAQISNRRVVATASYRLAYRIPEVGDLDKSVTQDGVLRLQAALVDDWLSMDLGGIITRSRVDPSGPAPQFATGDMRNLTQTYSAFVQPSLAHRFGDLGVAMSYRYAYTRNESSHGSFSTGLPVDRFDSSRAQRGTINLGMEPGELPFGWKLAAEHRREDTTNLDEQFRSISAIGEVRVPLVSAPVALVASGGYERTRVSERRALYDPVTGLPVPGKGGRFVVDPDGPRVLTYDVAGLVAEGGIIWRPSRRTRFEARAGRRYGGVTVTGLLEMRPSERTGLTFLLSDRMETFGQGLSGALAEAPPALDLDQFDPGSVYQDCLFGKIAGTGRCIGATLGQASANAYRERAATIIFNRSMRSWVFGASFGYSRRTYIDNPTSPVSLDGVVDQSLFGNLSINKRLSRVSGVTFSFNGNYFKNGMVGASDVLSGSASANYYRTFGRGIGMQATVAVDASKQDGVTADVSGRAQVGVQYRF